MRMNRRELGILSEIVKLRDHIAKERDLPLKYILADDVVGGLAVLKPKRPDELDQLRRLDAGARRSLGAAIVEAVARGEAIPEEDLPRRPERPLGQSRDTLAAVMGVIVGEIARENDLPQSLLVPRSALERIARELPADLVALEAALELSHWRTQLVAQPLWRLLSGEATVAIEGYADGDPKIRLKP
jgi:ribonuclease D